MSLALAFGWHHRFYSFFVLFCVPIFGIIGFLVVWLDLLFWSPTVICNFLCNKPYCGTYHLPFPGVGNLWKVNNWSNWNPCDCLHKYCRCLKVRTKNMCMFFMRTEVYPHWDISTKIVIFSSFFQKQNDIGTCDNKSYLGKNIMCGHSQRKV